MCGRMTLAETDPHELAEALGIPDEQVPSDYRPHYNIAPMQEHPVVRMKLEERQLVVARWGLVNSWAHDNKDAARRINAKAETVERLPAFREAFKKRRCIVPCDGFFEWTGPKTARQPLWFHRPYGGLLFLAGLYESWRPSPDSWERTFTVITTGPNELTQPIHDRMPAILGAEDVDRWLDPKETDVGALKAMLRPAPEELLIYTPVTPLVNNVKNDDPSCLEPVQGALL